MPAFKQYDEEELTEVVERVQRPTKSALLKSRKGDGSATPKENTNESKGSEGSSANKDVSR